MRWSWGWLQQWVRRRGVTSRTFRSLNQDYFKLNICRWQISLDKSYLHPHVNKTFYFYCICKLNCRSYNFNVFVFLCFWQMKCHRWNCHCPTSFICPLWGLQKQRTKVALYMHVYWFGNRHFNWWYLYLYRAYWKMLTF